MGKRDSSPFGTEKKMMLISQTNMAEVGLSQSDASYVVDVLHLSPY